MSHTNSTENYGLPQWIGTDKPTFLGDFNSAFGTIDTQMKANADASASAVATANSAGAVATSANTNASTALSTANQALTDAQSAVSTAGTANSTAITAKTNADTALRASAANTIENLAPAYDPTLTYNVGDLVTYIDAQNSGKLYKCIVAVNSPMDFNINYWDDVTTSESYQPKSNIAATLTTDGVMTIKDCLESLYSQFTIDTTKEYTLIRRRNGITAYHLFKSESSYVIFGSIFTDSTHLYYDEFALASTGSTRRIRIGTTPSVDISSIDDSVPVLGEVWLIIES